MSPADPVEPTAAPAETAAEPAPPPVSAAPVSDLHRVIHGAGPTVLVMHGGLGLDHTHLRPWLDPLGDQVRLVYYDHRGNGQSPAVEDWSKITHESLVADADVLRAELGEERLVVLGHSYGAFLALEYALRYPERVASLVLVCGSPALQHLEASMNIAARRLSKEDMERLIAAFSVPATDEMYAREWPWLQRVYMHRHDEAVVAETFGRTIYRGDAVNHAMGVMAPRYDVRARLGEIKCPTLVIGGRHDWIQPPEHGAEPLHDGIPSSELAIFEESGHYPFLEEPAAFKAIVRDFLRRTAPPPA